jgi:hypothetical protein
MKCNEMLIRPVTVQPGVQLADMLFNLPSESGSGKVGATENLNFASSHHCYYWGPWAVLAWSIVSKNHQPVVGVGETTITLVSSQAIDRTVALKWRLTGAEFSQATPHECASVPRYSSWDPSLKAEMHKTEYQSRYLTTNEYHFGKSKPLSCGFRHNPIE